MSIPFSFKDSESPVPSLVIGNNKDSDKVKKTSLCLSTPISFPSSSASYRTLHIDEWSEEVIRDFVDSRDETSSRGGVVILKSSLHTIGDSSEDLPISNQQLRVNKVPWKFPVSRFGEVYFSEGYWEWVEDVLTNHRDMLTRTKVHSAVHASLFLYDCNKNVFQAFLEHWCPSTNSVFTNFGEVSISLSDLLDFGGLPIRGSFYDEMIPSTKELLQSGGRPAKLPRCCKYLFAAYHHLLRGVDGVPIESWVKFWFRGDFRYDQPPLKTSKKGSNRANAARFPDGVISQLYARRAKGYEEPFLLLGVKEDIRDRTYLAAFICCWLCKFVVPYEPRGCIRATTFVVASRMAGGETFSLAIPVLASIYRGLRDISSSTSFGESNAMFPIHYLYAWMAGYFHTHVASSVRVPGASMIKFVGCGAVKPFDLTPARDLFQKVDTSNFPFRRVHKTPKSLLRDVAENSEMIKDYFVSIRSSYLMLRIGVEHIFEAYSPHRFARQHGFCQDVPGSLKEEMHTPNLDKLAELWASSVLLDTSSTVHPMLDAKSLRSTQEYVDWWFKCWQSSIKKSKVRSKSKSLVAPKAKQGVEKTSHLKDTSSDRGASSHSASRRSSGSLAALSSERRRTIIIDDEGAMETHQSASGGVVAEKIDALLGIDEISDADHSSSKGEQLETGAIKNKPSNSKDSVGSVNKENIFDTTPAVDSGAKRPVSVSLSIAAQHVPTAIVEGPASKRLKEAPEPSVFEVSKFTHRIQSKVELGLLRCYWTGVCDSISESRLEYLPKVRAGVDKYIGLIKAQGYDTSALERRVRNFFDNAARIVETRLAHSNWQTSETYTEAVRAAEEALSEAAGRRYSKASEVDALQSRLTQRLAHRETLRKQLAETEADISATEASLSEAKVSLSELEKEESSKRDEVQSISDTPCLTDKEVAALKDMEVFLEDSKQSLLDFDVTSL